MFDPIVVRGASGLGDSCYIYPIVKSLITHNPHNKIIVSTNYPEIFSDLDCNIIPFTRDPGIIDYVYDYLEEKKDQTTTIIQDVLSKYNLPVNFFKSHTIRNSALIKQILLAKKTKKICVVRNIEPRHNKNHFDNFDIRTNFTNNFIENFSDDFFFVGIGKSNKYNIKCNLDLTGKTSIHDLLDLIFVSDLVIGQVGYTTAMCQLFHKKNISIFSKRWLNNDFLRGITPAKMCDTYTGYVYDTQTFLDIQPPPIKCSVTAKQQNIRNTLNNSKTIAIVGNATSMYKKNYAGMIDSHDCVIRMNRCQLNNKTGRKTTIWSTCSKYPETLPHQFQALKPLHILWHDSRDIAIKKLLKICIPCNHLQAYRIVEIHREPTNTVQDFHKFVNDNTVMPTTGLCTILYTILQLIEPDSHNINIFGFDFFDTPSVGESKINYYKHKPSLEKKYLFTNLLPRYKNIQIIQ